jgi:hypothetical protein
LMVSKKPPPLRLFYPIVLEASLLTLREGTELSEVVVRQNKALYVSEIDRNVINVAFSLVSVIHFLWFRLIWEAAAI